MRTNFSPMAEAARLHARDEAARRASTPPLSTAGANAENNGRWCEWPRRDPSNPPFASIRQALAAIQARHA
ncbi:MAG: hypothetical protein JWQ62_1568 [Lacunisphaera sp.]|jgi:hypothetical protein|nr:hypothetical protein [Lacunisphaera sp.]